MTSVKVDAEDVAFNIRKRQSFKISEDVWREKFDTTGGLQLEQTITETGLIEKKSLFFGICDETKMLFGGISFDMEDKIKVEGSGRVIIKKHGKKGISDEGYNVQEFIKLRKSSCSELRWLLKEYIQDEGIHYNQEDFLKNYLENGFVTVEVISEISVNGENMEDKKMKEKEAVVRDINNFCKGESFSDILVICEGEEIPCHRIILCSR